MANIFNPYLAGLFCMYCLKSHRPQKASSISSIVRYSETAKLALHFSTRVSNKSRMGATLSRAFCCNLVLASSNLITLIRNLNLFKFMQLRKNSIPVPSVAQRSYKFRCEARRMPAKYRSPMNASNSSLVVSFASLSRVKLGRTF